MTGIVDVGGGMRGVFSAGIYDRFIEEGINFDLCIGVSAGSANLISYAAGHHDRVRRFYVNYAQRKQYMSFDNFIHSGSYIGLDYIYSTISNSDGEDPLNYDAFTANHTDFITVVTDGETGEPIYFPKNSIKRDDLIEDITLYSGAVGPDDEETFWSLQAGIEKKWLAFGKTTIYGEYYRYEGGSNNRTIDGAFAGVGTANGAVIDTGLEVIGGGIAQGFENAALTLYLSYRHVQGDLVASSIAGGIADGAAINAVDLEDLDVVFAGGIIKF